MKGAERFKELLGKYRGRPVMLYGDPDMDGLVSLRFMCEFCNMVGIKDFTYYVNSNRHHGFALDKGRLRGYLVIAADFAITRETMQELVDADVAILSTDHHECESDFIEVSGVAEGIVINNQYPFEPVEDRYLSGAGVFYELICGLYPGFISKEREALVGVTLLSDVRQIENPKARGYLKAAYTADTENGFVNYLLSYCPDKGFAFGAPRLDRNFIDYYLNPLVNSMLRMGRLAEAVDFILGHGLKVHTSRKHQGEFLAQMEGVASVMEFPHIHFLAVPSMELYGASATNFIGLLCSRHKDANRNITTLGMVVENGVVLRASFRGKYDDVHYQSAFRMNGVSAEGHSNAFGMPQFLPTGGTWMQLEDLVSDLEAEHKATATIVESSNLAATLLMHGDKYAEENCYVRDMYRTYIRYVGRGARVVNTTYKVEEFQQGDYLLGMKPDMVSSGVAYRYVRDMNGNPIPKYIEYQVDGRKVKSFGVGIENGLILPIKEKGYMHLYVRGEII